ncbi:MAG: diguanylate cyclase domain-containing protein [Lachnotalea sp.]
MGKKFKLKINILILATILIGFLGVCVMSYISYSKIIRDDIKNISKLTSTNIYSDISNELTKPIFVSLTMANDSFLKNWLEDETDTNLELHEQKLLEYLNGIKEKYNYNSVFLVSDSTLNYYHFNGVNKVISADNEHDQWYYDFLDSNKLYDLEIDTDEANGNKLSVFINCRIEDEEGNLLGVTGVGLEMNQVQQLLKTFSNDFDLEAMLFNSDGNVLINSNTEATNSFNIFDIQVLKENKQNILADTSALGVYKYSEGQSSGYLITRYIDDLDWYLLIKKDTSILVDTFKEQLLSEFVIISIVILCVLLIVSKLIIQNDSNLKQLAKVDTLTNMYNRRGFNESIENILKVDNSYTPFYVFVLDIDCFKNINDSYGHLFGDKIIKLVGQISYDRIPSNGMIARWGGDEFTGYLYGTEEEVIKIVERIFESVREDKLLSQYKVTISLGLTCSQIVDTVDTVLLRADRALYEAKELGRDRYVII